MKAEFSPFGILIITTETAIEHYAMRKWLDEKKEILLKNLLIHFDIPEKDCEKHEKLYGKD